MFKIALTPCSLRGRPVCTNSGVNQARGRRGGAAVRGERGGVGAVRTGGAWPRVTHRGRQGQRPPQSVPRPKPTVGEGGVRPLRPPSVRRGNWGHPSESHLLLADYYVPFRAGTGHQVSRARTSLSLRVGAATCHCPGEGWEGVPPPGENRCVAALRPPTACARVPDSGRQCGYCL